MSKALVRPPIDCLEGELQRWVIATAVAQGWRVHVTMKRARGMSLRAAADWPDLEMFHVGLRRYIWVELKAHGKHPTDEQMAVLNGINAAVAAWGEVYVWEPAHMDTIEDVLKGQQP